MKNLIRTFAAACMMLPALTACEKESESATAYWKSENQAYLDSLDNVYKTQGENGELKRIVPYCDRTTPLYYKVLGADLGYVGDGNYALFTDTAVVYYKAKDITGLVVDSNFSGDYPDPEKDIPSEFAVGGQLATGSGIIYGWTEILQRMRAPKEGSESKGDFFQVYIPWSLAYGTTGQGDIKGYTVLIFDINLVGIKPLK